MTEPLKLREPDRGVYTRSRCWSFLGFTWWSSRVTGYYGLDCQPRRPFLSRDVERAEAKAIANFVHWDQRRQAKVRDRRHV